MRIGVDFRILLVGAGSMSRGIPRFVQQQLREVLRLDRDTEYVLVCRDVDPGDLIDAEIRAAPNVTLATFPYPPGFDVWDAAQAFRLGAAFEDWLAGLDLDLFHLSCFGMPPVFTDFDACPLAATSYDMIPYVFPAHFLASRFWEPVQPAVALFANADRVLTLSEFAKTEIHTHLGIPRSRIGVTPPYADPSFRPMDAGERARALDPLRRRVGLPDRFALSVSFATHTKNLRSLLAGFGRAGPWLRTTMPLVLCCWAPPAGTSEARKLAHDVGADDGVIFLDRVTDAELAALYNEAVLYVCPSRAEGFGYPVLEAMSCGTPVVSSSAASLPEVVGDAAVLVDPFDPDAMIEAMFELLGDEARRADLRERGLARARQFSPGKLGRATLDAYRRTARARDGARGAGTTRVAVLASAPARWASGGGYGFDVVDRLAASYEVEVFVDDEVVPPVEVLQAVRVLHRDAFPRRHRQEPFAAVVDGRDPAEIRVHLPIDGGAGASLIAGTAERLAGRVVVVRHDLLSTVER